MLHKSKMLYGVLVGVLGGVIASPLPAVEIVTKEDIVNKVIKEEQLVRVADNAIFLLDTSSSTNDKYGSTGQPVIQVVKNQLKNRNSYFPNIGHRVGVYTYTGWKELLPVQAYNRDKVAAAFDAMPAKGGGATPLNSGLAKLDPILGTLKGRTAVFVFWDGEYTGANPADNARVLAKNHDACFYVISSAKPEREAALAKDVATLNACSRVIPLADFVNRPDYISGALYDVKVTEKVVTSTEKKITGVKVDDINFATNEAALSAHAKGQLDKLAEFMKGKPGSYAVVAGYTDNTGTRDHNEGLSRGRAEMVGRYLKEKGIDSSRVVMFWYGPNNPIVANDSAKNKAKNRRVEVNVGLGS